MLGSLSQQEMEQLLLRNVTGRIGCRDGDRIYIVPVSYVYHDKSIIAHSTEGLKIKMMRKTPDVCFEVDEIQDMANWQSVIGTGRFEEIHGEKEKYYAMKFLVSRLLHMRVSETAHLPHMVTDGGEEVSLTTSVRPVVYRIRFEFMTGRYEKT
ncbi:pyridoxamine 5'-phosphate oxidase family protein [Chitinophaga agri]|uniref:Pyridoxamine 5'-phosphate oxidase family protein n=1 Tax=Chitinophaga agri TaxID=2703787 RepID=A0A6B9Z9A3_9BACT|nr:pyridoxamine 5'-phosphate oxidase family protein [Chitinophaga agri]QHS58151.1 pyridoxamine 5'-phosphate oxidase family protein [Chitinophaga agri]